MYVCMYANVSISRRVCLLAKMAPKTIIRTIFFTHHLTFFKNTCLAPILYSWIPTALTELWFSVIHQRAKLPLCYAATSYPDRWTGGEGRGRGLLHTS